MGKRTAAALGLFGLVVLLVVLPRIPDRAGGGLWLWLAGYGAALLLLVECWREWREIGGWWARRPAGGRAALALAAVAATLVVTLLLRAAAPDVFGKLSRENGLWEPLSLVAYWGAGILVARHSAAAGPEVARRWRAIVLLFALLGLEEIDYFGVFGGLIGRIEGVYAGSLHDLIRLVTEGVLTPVGIAVVAAVLAGAVVVLWRTGFLDLAFLADLARGREIGWLVLGFALLVVAASEEAHLFGWVARPPTPEEAVELAGAVTLAAWALELVGRRLDAGRVAPCR